MDLSFSDLSETEARFILSGVSIAYANALRRAMIGEVPTLAIEDVRIYDNTSALFDEILAHRMGLIPIKTDLTAYVPADQCSCGGTGCPGCTATFTLSVEGPKMVLSSDLIPQDPSARPAYDNVPIVKLTQDQKLVLEARAVVKTGKDHSKWQPTLACGYKNYPVITVGKNCDGCSMCVDECPRKILEIKGGKVRVVEGKLESCSLCRLCERACLSSGIGDEPEIRITTESDRFIFVVESDGSLPVKEIITRSVLFIKDRATELEKQVIEVSGGTVS
ncbi:MAG: DNA-directed RNA polymerase subunit D [Methanoregulaceae archaeon]